MDHNFQNLKSKRARGIHNLSSCHVITCHPGTTGFAFTLISHRLFKRDLNRTSCSLYMKLISHELFKRNLKQFRVLFSLRLNFVKMTKVIIHSK